MARPSYICNENPYTEWYLAQRCNNVLIWRYLLLIFLCSSFVSNCDTVFLWEEPVSPAAYSNQFVWHWHSIWEYQSRSHHVKTMALLWVTEVVVTDDVAKTPVAGSMFEKLWGLIFDARIFFCRWLLTVYVRSYIRVSDFFLFPSFEGNFKQV